MRTLAVGGYYALLMFSVLISNTCAIGLIARLCGCSSEQMEANVISPIMDMTYRRNLNNLHESSSVPAVDSTWLHNRYWKMKEMFEKQQRNPEFNYDRHHIHLEQLAMDCDVSFHPSACLCQRCTEYAQFMHHHFPNCRICQGYQADEAAPSPRNSTSFYSHTEIE